MYYLIRLVSFLLKGVFRDNQDHIVVESSEEEDWAWESPDAIQEERESIVGTVESEEDLVSVFEHIYGVFDRGFGEPQIVVLENVAGKLKPNESRNFVYQTSRNGKPAPLKVTIECQRIDVFKIWIETSKSTAGIALPRIGVAGFEFQEN